MSVHRRTLRILIAVGLVAAVTATTGASVSAGPVAARTKDTGQADAIRQVVRQAMADQHMKAAIVSVNIDGQDVITEAFGDTIPGVPATTGMSFRNGAVAFAYLGTLLLRFVDDGTVRLDDTIDRWLPGLPDANKVTLLMLANQTAGYPDFEQDPAWRAAYYADPYHSWTYEERLAYIVDPAKRPFPPGTNWSYSHSNFMILGEALARIAKQPLANLLQERVLKPMKLRNTVESPTSSMPSPFLHSFSAERAPFFHVPAGTPFYEEETFWNTQWGTPMGANETSTIGDLVTTAIATGTGRLLSDASYHAMTDPNLLGFGHPDAACGSECFTQTYAYNFGIGVVRNGSWIKQNPVLTGYAAVEAYLPSKKIAIAIVNTYAQEYFQDPANLPANPSNALYEKIGALLAPNDAPPPFVH
ncbi:MAG: serine hydrolase domain-containing protein [Lapillicoccus sp.]